MHDAVARECRTTRASVGLFDASTLGKIEVVGPDAATFLERMYANAFQKLEVGRCRYGLMLSEAGFLMDDGVIARLAPDRFHVTTTTGGAPRVLAHMEDYLQTEFTDLKVWLDLDHRAMGDHRGAGTEERANASRPLVEGLDLSDDAFPHMSVREARICGVPARLMRVSFTGELGYEINVPSHYGRAVWEAVWREVQKHGGCAYGTEAMHVMRAEKGYVIVGQETDGTVTLADLGLDWAIGKDKEGFRRQALAHAPRHAGGQSQAARRAADRQSGDRARRGRAGDGKPRTRRSAPPRSAMSPRPTCSAALGRSIALALVAAGRSRIGAKLHVPMPGRGDRRDGGGARSSMTRRERGSMADAALEPRSPLEGFAFPAGPRFVLVGSAAGRALHPARGRGGARRLRHGVRRRAASQLGAAGEVADARRSGSGPTNGC